MHIYVISIMWWCALRAVTFNSYVFSMDEIDCMGDIDNVDEIKTKEWMLAILMKSPTR